MMYISVMFVSVIESKDMRWAVSHGAVLSWCFCCCWQKRYVLVGWFLRFFFNNIDPGFP